MKPALWMCFLLLTMGLEAQDSASVLAHILADKGAISASELARIESVAPADRVAALASLLQQKGVLTPAEVAKVSNPAPSQVKVAETGEANRPNAPQAAGTRANEPQTRSTAAAPPVTVQSKFPVTIYGTLLMNAFYNTAATNIQDIPLFTAKQGADALGNDKNFGMTVRQSRFGMRYQGGEIAGGKLTGQLELDLLGGQAPFGNGINMDLVRVRLAYGRLDWSNFSFEAGQDWALFAPLNPTSLAEFAIPSMSASGNPWIRMPQLRGEFHGSLSSGTKLLAQIAAIDPNMGDYSTATFSASRTPGIGERGRAPGAEVRLALSSHIDDRDLIIGFSSHYTHGKNSGVIAGQNVQLPMDSWGAAIDYTIPFSKYFNWSGELYTGRALGIFSVESGESILAPGGAGQRGVRSSGGWTQAQINMTRQWQVNLAYGIDDPLARDLPVGNRTRNQTYMGNLMYKWTPNMTVAWEYRRLLTDFRNQRAANERGDVANLGIAYIF
jgi:hypothetical protein